MVKNSFNLSVLAVLIMISIPLFCYLSVLPIRDFDEARNALNALEMIKNGDLIVTHFERKPDMWNTKPPLLIWFQALGIKLFGPGEFALRLPSAIAAFLTCISLLIFCLVYLKNKLISVISVMVLITANGFVNVHSAMTGDYDSMLTLFIFLYSCAWFLFIETSDKKYLTGFFSALTLSLLTKGIAGMFFLPGLLIYTLFRKKLWLVIKERKIYYGIAASLLLVIAYYLLRENLNPGYLNAVWENELGGRYSKALENNQGGPLFYIHNFISSRLEFWYLLVPVGMITGSISKDPFVKRVTFFSTILVLTFLFIISSSKTKCFWYDLPLFPFLALLISVPLYQSLTLKFKGELSGYNKILHPILIGLVVLLFYEPARKTFKRTINPKEQNWEVERFEIGYLLQDAVQGKTELNDFRILHEGYSAHILFYLKLLNQNGKNISFVEYDSLRVGDKIIVHQKQVYDKMKKFEVKKVFERKNVTGLQIEKLNTPH